VFKLGQRKVTVDGVITVLLDFNDIYQQIYIEDEMYLIRLGAPTRELYINGEFYACYFGPTAGIQGYQR
jgi:pre-mRNA cleavage complex 2 protein Pcf11